MSGTNQKKLTGIYEIGVRDGAPYADEICIYDFAKNKWRWHFRIGDDKRRQFTALNTEAFKDFETALRNLEVRGRLS